MGVLLALAGAIASPALADVEVRETDIPTPAGDITVRIYRPTSTPSAGAIVWAHGGAWVGGSIDMPEGHWVGLSLAVRGVTVYSVDYHLSLRGITFPVPSDDLLATYDWARGDLLTTGADDIDLHLGGASAGGNLAAGVAKRLARRGTPPASLVLAYPSLHSEFPEPSTELAAVLARVDFPDTLPGLLAFTMAHFAGEAGVHDEIAVPGNGAVPAGHARTLILNADADPLRASGELYGNLLRDADVQVEMDYLSGSLHGFLNEPESDLGRVGIDRVADWLLR
ncbi:alpha/beta hydrolase fold domain-containing protein [Microbacterium sp.]|uniref:alpha/beta hydrolase fold domain-containing protein n=1 Tax=Microbacterium sp. TaxID=51671 RepID=UPI003A8D6C32